jgi:hypothetical protein
MRGKSQTSALIAAVASFSAGDLSRSAEDAIGGSANEALSELASRVMDRNARTTVWRCSTSTAKYTNTRGMDDSLCRATRSCRESRARRGDQRSRRNRSWAREYPGQRDEAWFKREIARTLDAFTSAEIAGATVPHPRHWDRLAGLTASTNAHSRPTD